MLLASKGLQAMGPADRDLLSIVIAVTASTERYRGRITYAQAEGARRAGDPDLAFLKARELQAMPGARERSEGLIVEALVLRARGDLDGSMDLLGQASELSRGDVGVQCETAETLIQADRLAEAREVLDRLVIQGNGDGEQLERIFYQLGTVSLRTGDGAGAVRFFSKSRGAAREKENGELYLRLSDAYGLMGMREKADEYAVRAKKVSPPRVTT
jgi:tetratricopeptide (TPR) repeat protein